MSPTFVKTWNASTQPRKQRSYRYAAPLHIRGKFLSVNLSKDLRAKYGTRHIRVRKNDSIKVMRGQYSGKTGKVDRVSIRDSRVYVTGIDHTRKDGTKNLIPLEPSNLQIVELDTSDKKRFTPQSSAVKSTVKKQ
jgi:large subunit ribosomal protein L24